MNKCNLGSIAKSQTGPFGSQLHEEDYVDEGTPIVTVEHLGEISFTTQNLPFVAEEDTKRLSKYLLQEGDIVFSRVGSIDRCVYVKKEQEGWLFSGRCLRVRCDEEKVNARYLSYYFKLAEFKKMMLNISVGATMPSLNTDLMDSVQLNLLERNKQDKIADLLNDIDGKIEKNNEVNAELEAMARTIYDYWFLQFDFPDENGKPYKSSGGKMVWNEELKREIPEGWKVKRIKDCVKHINTGLNPRDNFVLGQGDIKYVTVKNLMSNGTLDFASCDTIDSRAKKIIHKRSDVAKGDILFASIAPLGRCFIVQEEPEKWDINESVFSIRPNIDMVSKEYLYLFFISQAFVRLAEFSSTGSVFYGIRISTLENMQIIIPDEDTMQKFTNYTSDILYKKYLNFIGNHELASLRDFLLPLLMNGQVGFKEC